MADFLVIVESPAKAKTIEKFLGKKYVVKASVGHIRDLPKSKMGIDFEDDFEPKYINIRGKGPVIKELRKEAKKAKKVFIATDPDREGEAIAWHLTFILGIDPKEDCRVTFREITKNAVKQAIKNPRAVDTSLVDAQQARRILDRLVGYSISPILWRKVKKGLSAGRVQSVATKMICDREREIKAFTPEEYWNLTTIMKEKGSTAFPGQVSAYQGEKLKVVNEQEASQVEKAIKAADLLVTKVDKKERQRKPVLSFTTSSLQQEAANRYNFSTKKTMVIAQKLYEGVKVKGGTTGLITYMRTDSTRVSDEAKEEAASYITENFGEEYLSGGDQKSKSKKGAQDAHEAIRPTSALRDPESLKDYLDRDQFKLYSMIWERFMASQMAPAKFESIQVTVQAGDYEIKSSGNRLLFDGYLKVYTYGSVKDKLLPALTVDTQLELVEIEKEQKFTQPPNRYTEASLVKEMEDKGIGRPSTYAPTISTIISRGYVARDKKNLVPTELGFIIDDIMGTYFNNIVAIDFTADMEERFDQVEEGDLHWKEVIREFYGPFEKTIDKAEEAIEKVDLTEETDIDCEKCGHKMVIRHGKYGKFLACSNYPDCTNTKPILDEIGIPCPLCETGQIVERRTKKFKVFYGCSTFPDCNFVSWNKPVDKKCPTCGSILVEGKGKKKDMLLCSNSECNHKEMKK